MKRIVIAIAGLLFATGAFAGADYSGWSHTGSIYILTTPEGADLPSTALLENFPVLIRLNKTFFHFGEAKPDGADIRFSTGAGDPLAYQIEAWDAAKGEATTRQASRAGRRCSMRRTAI